MVFYQACKEYLIHPRTFEFVKSVDEMTVDTVKVPQYLWSHGDKLVFTEHWGRAEKSLDLELNNLRVDFMEHGSFFFADITTRDEAADKRLVFNLMCSLDVDTSYTTFTASHVAPTRTRVDSLRGIDYQLRTNGEEVKIWRHEYNKYEQVECQFETIPEHGKTDVSTIGVNSFSMGLSNNQWRVRYHGKTLNGECYAFVGGPWGILLSDDLKFDSLVYLSAVGNGTLVVEKVLYTVNPYIVKIMTLIK